jgi:hypothetical protein
MSYRKRKEGRNKNVEGRQRNTNMERKKTVNRKMMMRNK